LVSSDTNSDLELIVLGGHIFDTLGLKNIKLHINSLGDKNDKKQYAGIVTKFFTSIKSKLDDYQLNTLNKNPLRLLDSKKDNIRDILEQIPTMTETLSNESKTRFNILLDKLDAIGIDYILDNSIVRGLDYYNDTVFEWRDMSLGSQNAVCAGR
jgi:histidyl-tRNA synthetase